MIFMQMNKYCFYHDKVELILDNTIFSKFSFNWYPIANFSKKIIFAEK